MFARKRSVIGAGLLASTALLLGWAVAAHAQEAQPNNMQAQPAPGKVVRAHDLLGTDVKNDRGEKVGSVKEIVLSPQRDRVSYVALSANGKLFPIPWQAFGITPEGRLSLNVEKNHFDNLRGFDRNNYPAQADMNWRAGTAAAAERREERREAYREQMRLRKVNEIVGTSVRGSDDKKLGDIENLIIETPAAAATASPSEQPARETDRVRVGVGGLNIDVKDSDKPAPATPRRATPAPTAMQQGEGFVTFAIVSYGGILGIGEKMSAVPWSALNFDATRDVARLNATKDTLESTAFASDKYPDFANRQWSQGVYQKYNAEPYWQVYGYTGRPSEAAGKAWMADSDYNKQFAADKMITVQGTIESVSTFRPAPNAALGHRLRVKAEDGKTYIVHLGPASFIEAKGLNLANGDTVHVTGAQTDMEGRTVVMATQIRKGDQTLQLRDQQGKPLWTDRDLTPSPSMPSDQPKSNGY